MTDRDALEHADAAPQPAPEQRQQDVSAVEHLATARGLLSREIHKVIVGQEDVIDLLLIALFGRGHCLLVGVPGLAKTLLIRTLADVLKLEFNRIQFTPDLMPSDITGTEIIEEDVATGHRNFRFVQGPVFANMVLADEINRTPPKTQAALLQAMQEYQITAAGKSYDLEQPFFVLATQNPIEQEGTYPLPEAQLDRFMFMIYIDYPQKAEEREIIKQTTYEERSKPHHVLRGRDILGIQNIVRRVPISDHVINYAVALTRATRPADESAPEFVEDWLTWGAGPRAAQYLVIGGKARAIMDGRYNVSCADIRSVAHPVLRHRIFTNFNADAEGVKPDDIITRIIDAVPEPSAAEYV